MAGLQKTSPPLVIVVGLALVCAAWVAVSQAASSAPTAQAATKGKVYLTAGEQFAPVNRLVHNDSDEAELNQLLKALLKGPKKSEIKQGLGTGIPRGSRVRSARIESDGIARVFFNAKFAQADHEIKGRDDATKTYFERLGQVTFTVASLPGVKKVRISAQGKTATTLTRDSFTKRDAKKPSGKSPAFKGPKPGDTLGIQQSLINLKYLPPGAATGNYDYRTSQAVFAFQGWEGLGRDGIVGPLTAARLGSASPPALKQNRSGRWIEVHRASGVVLLGENKALIRAIHTSTGRGGNSADVGTPPGRFKIYRKERNSWSVPYKTWLPFASYWNGGWAFHAYTDVPAYPASHGCARLPVPEAPIVYSFAKLGTAVFIY
jgi:Sporulation and spore germination/L,D-transpeptidase catalytic domain/Putative peptidoglycan binding domain